MEFKKNSLTIPPKLSSLGHGWFSSGKKKENEFEDYVYHISQIENVLQKKAKAFPGFVEIMAILRGSGTDKMDEIILPRAVGVKSDDPDIFEKFFYLTGVSTTTFALDSSGKLGLLIISSKNEESGLIEGTYKFIPSKNLILDKPLSSFIAKKDRDELFPDKDSEDITEKDIIDFMIQSQNKKRTTYLVGENKRIEEILFIPFYLEIELYGTKKMYAPTNEFLKKALSVNKFDDGTHFGDVHIHYGFTEQEIQSRPELQEMFAFDPNFPELLTPYDALNLKSSRQVMESLGFADLRNILRGIVWLDIKKNVKSTTYFDVVELSKNVKAFNKWDQLATEAGYEQSTKSVKEYFALTRQFSYTKRPDYAS